MGDDARAASLHINLSADIHGHAVDFASDTDRKWFADHPGQNSYERLAVEHEFCSPLAAADGRCVPLIEGVPEGADIVVQVDQIEPGFRTRRPILVLYPEDAA